MDLKLPSDVLGVLKEKASVLRTELERAVKEKIALDKEIADIQTKVSSIDSLIGESGTAEGPQGITSALFEKPPTVGSFEKNIRRLSLPKAAFEVLKSQRRSMTAAEVLDILRKAGREMRSPNSRDMVSGALKQMPDKVEIQKDGHANLYRAK